MRYYKDRKQLTLDAIPSWHSHLSLEKVKVLENTWAGPFREFVLPNLPIAELGKYYSDSRGRPTKELYTIIGAVILQQIHDLTDEQTREQLAFNQQWHYALDNFDPDEHVISLKSIWTMRQHLTGSGLAKSIFNDVADEIIDKLNVDTGHQRLDSVHVHSNMARMGRVTIMSRTITKFLRNLNRQHSDTYHTFADNYSELIQRYYNKNSEGYFGKVKPSESSRRLIDIANDLYFLLQYYSDDKAVTNMRTYKIMARVFSEQCSVEDGEVIAVANKEIPSSSVQNPSDEDAAYDGHKGSGYQTQILETYQPDKPQDAEPQLEIITHVEVESADCHDSNAVAPAIEDVTDRDIAPEVLLADTAYGGDDNVEQAKEQGVELVAPVPGNKNDRDFSGFEFDDETDHVISCPAGHEPDKFYHKNKTGRMTAVWNKETCTGCPLKDQCSVKEMKRGNRLHYTSKDLRLWRRRQYENSDEFKDQYRYRAGVEASISRFIYQTGARRSRYRGLEKVTFAQVLKAMGLNIFRTAKYVQKVGISFGSGCFSLYKQLKKVFRVATACFWRPIRYSC